MSAPAAAAADLASIVGERNVRTGAALRPYLSDATEARGLAGSAELAVLPGSAEEVAAVVAWCYERGVPIVPRGGGTGFAGGCVPLGGEVVVSLERLRRARSLDPTLWRGELEAGLTTREVQRLARESGLWFPPDPGAAEQSQLGGNIATNAGGPHAFKYGVTRAWVTGVEAVVAPGELIRVGGPLRKDVAGYDLLGLLVGSEGTLGIVTSAWLRFIPPPEAALPVVSFHADPRSGCEAIEAALASGVVPAALEYLDAGTLSAAAGSFPGEAPSGAFMVIAEADGAADEARAGRDALVGAVRDSALSVHAPDSPAEVAALWAWREGVSIAVTAKRGGKLSEDIVVPLDRLADAIEGTAAIGARVGVETCSWGHAGDGNLHSTLMVDPADPAELRRAEAACDELFALAIELGGSISGEHGLGLVKSGHLRKQWPPRAVELHEAVKEAFDPRGLFNPRKKRP
ncbi:MAG: FAD-binding protein [Thermoleophilaceae bacterium]|nr:FAD-binding protein [Thermoleophilaceae bacterium]